MIRMGRNNTNMKPETAHQSEPPNSDANKSGQQFGFSSQASDAPPIRAAGSDTSAGSNRAFTDSEGMTRILKRGV